MTACTSPPLSERLAQLGNAVVAVLSEVLLRDRIVVAPLLLVPITEVALGVVPILDDPSPAGAALPGGARAGTGWR